MKREDLLNYIGDVEPRFIEELFEEPVSAKRKHGRRGMLRVIAACLAVVMLGTGAMLAWVGDTGSMSVMLGVGGLSQQLHMKSNSIMMIDVNPSIQFEINDRNVVVRCDALNDDAEKLSVKLDVVGKNYNEAIEITIKALKEAGYISGLKNSVLITVLDNDEERALEIRNESTATVDVVGDVLDLSLSLLSQIMNGDEKCYELAKQYKVSSGKIALIEKICDANKDRKDLNVATLAGSSIQSINQLLQFLTTPEGVSIVGTVAGAVPERYLREIGIDELDTEELLNLVEAAADFFGELSKYYTEDKVAKNDGYDLKISKNAKSATGNTWNIVAEGKNGHSQGATIDTRDGSVDNFCDQETVTEVIEFIDAIDRIFGSAPVDIGATEETEVPNECEIPSGTDEAA